MSNNELRDVSTKMRHNRTTRTLTFDHVDMWDEGLRIVSEFLIYNDTLAKMSLKHCNLTSSGIGFLLGALRNNGSVEEIDVSGNNICERGAHAVLDFVQKRKRVGGREIRFEIRYNPMVSSKLANAIYFSHGTAMFGKSDVGTQEAASRSPFDSTTLSRLLKREASAASRRKLAFHSIGNDPPSKLSEPAKRNASGANEGSWVVVEAIVEKEDDEWVEIAVPRDSHEHGIQPL